MRVLGICHDVLICSAALIEDGHVASAIAEERLDRVKQSRVFPVRAVERVLTEAGVTLAEVDEIAVAWNPGIELETVPFGELGARRWRTEHLVQVPGRLMQIFGGRATGELQMTGLFDGSPRVTYVDHYDAHLGASYYLSPYEEAAALVMDGRGERLTGRLSVVRGTDVTHLEDILFPHSLGLFYGAVTQFLGFKPDSDEWKVMALASYADSDNPYYERLSEMIRVNPDGTFAVALENFQFFNFWDRRMYSDLFIKAFGEPRKPGSDLRPEHEQLAAAMQRVFEEASAKVLTSLHERTGVDRVVVSGGCFMNSVFNGRIAELTPFVEAYVPSCPDDSGTSIGAALFVEAQRSGRKASTPPQHNYWGPAFSDEECLAAVERYGLPGAEVVADPATSAAVDLVGGRIVGWFQGCMEFGQRALGNRSILLDPRRPDGKDVVNAAVKYRESFRPFAPAILREHVAEWFECPDGTEVPFMERVLRFRPDRAAEVPAVVHEDGTGRLQTVGPEHAPRYHALISEFHRRTGVPIVLNTSFNLNGEPIVFTPEDAIRTFYTCGLEVLYLGNVRVAK